MATNGNKVGTSQPGIMSSSPFLGGLNTELSGIVDSTDFTKDELNMLIRADGTRSRRPGVDYEELFKFNTNVINDLSEDTAFSCIEWYDINSPDEAETYDQTPYIVVQIGDKLIFYRNHGQPFSNDIASFTLDLAGYALDDPSDPNYRDPGKYRCKYTVAYGCLFITSEAIHPIRLRSAQEEVIPDFVTSFPECQVSVAAYQGKHQRMCSTSDRAERAYCKIYFDNILILNYTVDIQPGSERATFPNSYTLAEAFNAIDSATRRGITAVPFENQPNHWTNPNAGKYKWTPADWITFKGSTVNVRGLTIKVVVYGWAYYSGHWKSHTNTYQATMSGGSSAYTQSSDLTLTIRDTSRGAEDYLPIDENPSKLSYAHLYNLLNQGWTPDLIGKFWAKSATSDASRVFPGNNLAQQYLKDKKTDAFKPEDLINMTFGNTPAARGHIKLEYFYQDRNTVANLTTAMQEVVSAINTALGTSKTVADILDTDFPVSDPTDPEEEVPVVKPKVDYVADTLAYAGRIFYLTGSTLLYSQVIAEDLRKAYECYTEADPTSEEISDVVETDGGLISLPDLGEGVKLAQVGEYILAFGTRSNMAITGTANNIFTATAYSAGALNAVPTQAPDSFVNTEYGLFYWGTTGITFIGPGDGGLAVQDLSTPVILTWFGKLTNTQHKYCKGVYSSSKKKVYWFYPSDDSKPRRLDSILVYDIPKQAFVPSKVATGYYDEEEGDMVETDVPEIVSGLSVKVPFKSIKEYPVTAEVSDCILEGDYIRTSERKSFDENSGIVFRLNSSSLADREIGETVDLLKIGDKVLASAEIISESAMTFKILGWSNSASRTAPITWFSIVKTGADQYKLMISSTQGVSSVREVPLDSWAVFSVQTDSSIPEEGFIGYNALYFTDDCFGIGSYDSVEEEFSDYPFVATFQDTAYEVLAEEDGYKILADDPIDSEEFTYESSTLLCLDVANGKVTFGDFRNNLLRDWTAGDWDGAGYIFDSYLISHPMNAASYTAFTGKRQSSLPNNKTLPYLITYFRRTETGNTVDGDYIYPSKCQGSVLWDWRTSGKEGKWSNPTDLYRPVKKDILTQGFIINKTNIRGIGRAYQLKMESVDDNQFIIEGVLFDLKKDGRI